MCCIGCLFVLPVMTSIFAQPLQGGRKPIIQFRAGKMSLQGNMVVPDKRKGVFSLVQDPAGMVEIVWSCGGESESTVVFPREATFNRVTKCTTGRVFVLDFKAHSRQLFFWLQEPSDERDEEYLRIVKKHIGDDARGTQPEAASSTGQQQQQQGPQGQQPQQAPSIELSTLQNILASLNANPPAPDVDLQDILGSDALLRALREDEAFYMSALHSHLPEGTDPSATIVDEVRNPQVSATSSLLQYALSEPDGFRELFNAFGLRLPAAQSSCPATQFLEAIEEEARRNNGSGGNPATPQSQPTRSDNAGKDAPKK